MAGSVLHMIAVVLPSGKFVPFSEVIHSLRVVVADANAESVEAEKG